MRRNPRSHKSVMKNKDVPGIARISGGGSLVKLRVMQRPAETWIQRLTTAARARAAMESGDGGRRKSRKKIMNGNSGIYKESQIRSDRCGIRGGKGSDKDPLTPRFSG